MDECDQCDRNFISGYCENSQNETLCSDFSPFTCGKRSGNKFSVYCNPNRDNCTSYTLPVADEENVLDLTPIMKKTQENYVYFGCVKIKNEVNFIIILLETCCMKTFKTKLLSN